MMEFVFSIFKQKKETLLMVFFKSLGNILHHRSLSGYLHEDSANKAANVFSLTFAGFYCGYQCERTMIMTITR